MPEEITIFFLPLPLVFFGTAVRRRGRASRSSQQPERARAVGSSLAGLGPKRQRRWSCAPRPFCTPEARLAREGEGWSERRGGPGREGTRAPSSTHSRRRLARRGRQRRYGGCPPGRCSGGALVTPRRRLRPEGRGLGRGERRGRERDGARLPNEPHGLRLGRRGHLLGRGGGRDGEVGRGKR